MMFIFELVVSAITSLAFLFLLMTSLGLDDSGKALIGPGVFPAILATIVLVSSTIWFIDTLVMYLRNRKNSGGSKECNSEKGLFHFTKEGKRLAEIIILTILYIMVLMPVIGFSLATLVFLFVSVMLFYGRIQIALIVSIFMSLAIYVLFQYVLLLPMPR